MLIKRFSGFPVVAYDLSEYEALLKPFCDWLVSDEAEKFTLGDDYESGRMNVWDVDSEVVRLMSAVFDVHCLEYLKNEHPKFKGQSDQFELKKDSWLTTPKTLQHIRIHTHLPPFIRAEDVGDLITIFYVDMDETIGQENGPFELFHSPDTPAVHTWAPRKYNLIIMTPEIWHRARPFTGRRFSLATDIKVTPV